MTDPTEDYTEEFISVNDLVIDRRVQRAGINRAKIDHMVKYFNANSLGLVHVSRRRTEKGVLVENVLLDGQHRHETVRIVTDGTGKLWCRVFVGLTLDQEAQMFLDLNRTTAPTRIDKFNVLRHTSSVEGRVAQEIADICTGYGLTVSKTSGPGHINCVHVLTKMYTLSELKDRSPNLVHLTILSITKAWGVNNRENVVGAIVEGIGAIFDVHGSDLDLDRLINVMRETEGGPVGLLARATQVAAMRQGKRSMAVAELLMEAYNKNLRNRSLGPWRRR